MSSEYTWRNEEQTITRKDFFTGLAMLGIIIWDRDQNLSEKDIAKAAVRQAEWIEKELTRD